MSCYNCCCCGYEDQDNRINHLTIPASDYTSAITDNCNKNNNNKISGNSLSIASCMSAFLSLVIVSIAIGTGEWLFTEEKLPKPFSTNTSVEPDSKVTYSGLWRVCVAISKLYIYIP